MRGGIPERFAYSLSLFERGFQLRTRFDRLAGQPPEERDPEIRVGEHPPVGTVATDRDRAFELFDGPAEAAECPSRFRDADRGPESQVDARVIRGQELRRARKERDRLSLSETLERVLSGDDEVLGGAPRVASLLEVHRDDRGELATPFRVQREEGVGRELVQRTPVLLEQRAVCGVLDEGMPEEVLELWLHRGDLDQATSFEGAEVGLRRHVVGTSSRRSRIVTPN